MSCYKWEILRLQKESTSIQRDIRATCELAKLLIPELLNESEKEQVVLSWRNIETKLKDVMRRFDALEEPSPLYDDANKQQPIASSEAQFDDVDMFFMLI